MGTLSILRLTSRSAATYDRARYRWSIGAERWRTRRDEQELRAGSLIHLDFRLSFTVVALWALPAGADRRHVAGGASASVCAHCPAGCPGDSAFLSAACGDAPACSFKRPVSWFFLACIVTCSSSAFVRYGVDASRATLQQAQGHRFV